MSFRLYNDSTSILFCSNGSSLREDTRMNSWRTRGALSTWEKLKLAISDNDYWLRVLRREGTTDLYYFYIMASSWFRYRFYRDFFRFIMVYTLNFSIQCCEYYYKNSFQIQFRAYSIVEVSKYSLVFGIFSVCNKLFPCEFEMVMEIIREWLANMNRLNQRSPFLFVLKLVALVSWQVRNWIINSIRPDFRNYWFFLMICKY